jgi:hypothetical protein
LNSKSVPVAADGAFSTNVTLKSGSNVLLFEVTDPVGNTETLSIEVEYKPQFTDVESFLWVYTLILIVIMVAIIVVIVVIGKRKKAKAAREIAAMQAAPTAPVAQPAPAYAQPAQSYPEARPTYPTAQAQPVAYGSLPPPPPAAYYQPSQQAAPLPPPPPPQPSYEQQSYQQTNLPPPPPPPPLAQATVVSTGREDAKNLLDSVRIKLQDMPDDGIRSVKAKNNLRLAESFFNKGSYDKATIYAEKALKIAEEGVSGR